MTLGRQNAGRLIPAWVSLERHVLDCILVSVRSVRRHVKACRFLHPCRLLSRRVIKNYRQTLLISCTTFHCDLLLLFQQAIMSYFWSSRPIGNMLKNSRPPHNHCFYHFPPPQTKHSKEGDISDALEFETWFAQASTPSGPLPDVAIGSDALNIGKNDDKCIRGSILSVFASLVHFGIMVLTASRPRSNLAAFSTSGKRMVSTSAPWHKLKFVLAKKHTKIGSLQVFQVVPSILVCIPSWYFGSAFLTWLVNLTALPGPFCEVYQMHLLGALPSHPRCKVALGKYFLMC